MYDVKHSCGIDTVVFPVMKPQADRKHKPFSIKLSRTAASVMTLL